MQDLIDTINELKQSEIKQVIDTRLDEFSQFQDGTKEQIFSELCFCVMTANCGAEKCIEIHEQIGLDFAELTKEDITKKFRELGYRFPNVRSQYIASNQEKIDDIKNSLKEYEDESELRKWIVKNIKGLGYKEGSHFLRNIGFKNLAIIDFHIVDLLVKYGFVEKPKTMTKRKYLEIEEILKEIGTKVNLNMAELDLYLWYMETGKVLK